jgi:hypothetical protein
MTAIVAFWADPVPWGIAWAVATPTVLMLAGLGLMRFGEWLEWGP